MYYVQKASFHEICTYTVPRQLTLPGYNASSLVGFQEMCSILD